MARASGCGPSIGGMCGLTILSRAARTIVVSFASGGPWGAAVASPSTVRRGRALERRDLLLPGGGEDPDRSLAAAPQHCQATWLTGLSTAGLASGDAVMAPEATMH